MHPKFTKSIAFLSMFTAMMFFGTDTIAASESENIPTETPTQEILASQTNEETGDVHNDEVNVDEIDISEKNDEKTDAEEQGNGNVQDAETLNEQEAEIEATDTVQADTEESAGPSEALSASNTQDDSSLEFPGIKNLDSDWDQNWMSRLPDGAKINELSIPGAHDAAAHNVAGLDITGPLKAYVARTQDKYISELLETGTRYFDLRIDKTDDGDLGLCHGFMELYDKNNQRLKLNSVINDMRSFLTNHSGEALILQIKCDHDNCDAEIHEYFKSLVDEYPDLIYCGDHVPTLGEARGKMLIFSRLKLIGGVEGESETVAEYSRRRQGLYKMDDGTYWALEISSFNGGDSKTYSMAKTAEFGTSEVWTEDMYDVPRYRKNIYVNYSLLDHGNPPENNYAERVKQEAREKGVDAWSIIYSSMSYQNWASIVKDILLLPIYDDGSLARDMDWPIDGAQYMNPVLKELIASIPNLYTGCLVGDFYDSELLRQIYGSNFLRRNKDPWNSYYEVKFNSQGGSPVDSQQVFYDDKAVQPEDPVRDKYAFVGWYKDASGTEAYDFDTPVTTNITLFANWIEKFTVTFDANGHGTAPSSQTVKHGDKAVQPEALTEEGWTFGGWFKDASGSEAYDFATPVTADITLFANWTENEYTVTFDANGHGTAPEAQIIKHGDKAVQPEALTEEGWTFGGWFKDASGSEAYDFATPVTADLTLFANWTENEYTVSFDANGHGTAPSAQTIKHGDKAVQPEALTEEGWTFGGWYKDASGSEAYDFATPVTADLTLFANWTENEYTVSFDANGHGTAPSAQTIKHGDKAVQPEALTEEGWTFGGWYKDAAGTEAYDFATPVTADLTLFANWTENEYTVSFDANGHGTAPSAQTIKHGDKAVQPEALTEEGWTFVGWFKDASGTEAYDFATPVTADLTLFANWAENEYTVSFDANGHGTAPSAQTIKHGDKAVQPEALTEEGWTFVGWFKDASGTEAYDFATPVTADLTLFANWTENEYTVSFDANGHGTAPSAQTIKHGDKAVQPEALTEEGWTFVGWFKDASGTEAYDFATPVTADLTLFANWTENEYTVSFDANGHGTAPSAQTIKHGDKAVQPEALTEEGWTFVGWFKDASGTEAYDFATPVTADITLFANWTVNEYTVTFDANGHGTVPESQTIKHGDKAVQPEALTEEGWTFVGWFKDASGSEAYDFATPVTADITLFVKWAENATKYTISYDLNGGTLDGKTGIITGEAEDGTTITILAEPTREGYKFTYWKGSEYHPGDSYKVEGDHTFVAQWEKINDSSEIIKNDPTPENRPNTTNPTAVNRVGTPNTGLESHLLMWVTLMAASILALVLLFFMRMNNNEQA